MATDVQREQILAEAIGEISHIATLPEITLKIIELVEDPSSTAQDLHNLISIDPALCSRVLKVVNSSFYGLPGQIASINRAIVMLGLNAVKNIAIAA
ncbi:MAG: HDOD domain-containing protein, partial [Planctomycetota bacterium]